jgi:hypothetical protein
MTDNLILSVEGRQSNASGFRLLSVPNSSHFDYYIGAYRAAEAASRVINSIDIIPADAARDNIEAQARFIRALNFDMVRIYSKITSTDAKASLGMYYLDVEIRLVSLADLLLMPMLKFLADLLIAKIK